MNYKSMTKAQLTREIELLKEKVIATDDTGSEHIEATLQEREETIRYLAETSQDWIWAMDLEGVHTYQSHAVKKILGYEPDELLGKLSLDLMHEDDRKMVEAQLPQWIAEKRGWHDLVIRWRHKNGTWRYLESTAVPILDSKGELTGFRGIDRDITERKQAEDALRESEERFRNLMEYVPGVSIQGYDLEGKVLYWNKASEEVYGYTAREALGKNLGDLIIPADVMPQFEMALEIGKGIEKSGEFAPPGELDLLHKNGHLVPVYSIHTAVKHEGKAPILFCIDVDLSERKKKEEALRESEEKYRALIETTDTGYLIIGETGEVVDANPEYVRLTGHQRLEEILKKSVVEWTAAHDLERNAQEVKKCVEQGFTRNLEIDYVDKDGKITPIEINAKVVETEEGIKILSLCRDITERKRAEKVLRESEKRFREMADLLPQVVFETDIEGNLTFVNSSAFNTFGYTREDFDRGLNALSTLAPEDRARAEDDIREVLNGETTGGIEYTALRKDGSTFPIIIYSTSIIRENKPVGLRGIIIDITERKQAEEELRESEERLRKFTEATTDVIYRYDPMNNCYDFISPSFELQTGYSVKEIKADPSGINKKITHPDDVERVFREIDTHVRRGPGSGPVIVEYRVIRKDDQVIWVNDRKDIEFGPDGLVSRINGIVRDITERKRAEEALHESEGKYRAIFEQAADSIVLVDPVTGNLVAFNDRAHKSLGYSREEFKELKIPDFEIDESANEVRSHIEKITRDGFDTFETEHRTKGGDIRNIHVSCRVISIMGRSFIQSVWHDITERRRAELALRESEEELRDFFDNANDLIQMVTPEGRFAYVNRKWLDVLGYTREELADITLFDVIHPDSMEHCLALFQRIMTGERIDFIEAVFLTKDGRQINVEGSVSCRFEGGNPVNIRGIFRDVTERKILEEQLQQMQKMEAIGRLAGGVAHDFNNLLTVISGHAELALSGLDPNDPLAEDIKAIQDAAQRASNLTRQLLAFSRKQTLEPRVLDLNDVITNMDKMLRRIIGEDIELVTSSAPELGRVKVDPGQIEQVIVNLAVNGRDAMMRGGRLTIETTNVELDNDYVQRYQDVNPGPYVMIAVTDTGVGMPEETVAQIFDPFFTTKEVDKGTGLGLSTVYGIIRQSGGHIRVYSEKGKGTTFKIYFPVVSEYAELFIRKEDVDEVPRGTETILVVEDEDSVRDLACRILKIKGYMVLEAQSGGEAYMMCQKMKKPVDLVITDVVMPGISGAEFVEKLGEIWDDVKVLYMSGYTANAIVQDGILEPDTRYIQKPYRLLDLARKVREVLDE